MSKQKLQHEFQCVIETTISQIQPQYIYAAFLSTQKVPPNLVETSRKNIYKCCHILFCFSSVQVGLFNTGHSVICLYHTTWYHVTCLLYKGMRMNAYTPFILIFLTPALAFYYSENIVYMNENPLSLSRLILWPNIKSLLENISRPFEKNVYSSVE